MKVLQKIDTVKLPTYALCAVFNGDFEGLEEEDEKNLRDFFERYHGCTFDVTEENLESPYFERFPEFGLACEVVDCDIYDYVEEVES